MPTPLTRETVADYLVERGVFERREGLEAVELTGGISATVLAVRGAGKRVVVKQALARFRVEDEWLVSQDRVLAEARALELMAELAPGSVPRVLDLDRDAFTLVIEEAPPAWRPWKARLLEGNADASVATRLGELLSILHSADADIGSAESFDAQRVDPYLRTIQRRHPALAAQIAEYVERLLATTASVVHGDYSPKNVLVGDDGLWVIDWEIVHRGDPAFDLAFLLNHLLLKTIYRPHAREGYEQCALAFVGAYGRPVDLTHVLGLVGCLMLARVDGKSPAEYLDDDACETARAAGIALLTDPPSSLEQAWAGLPR